MTEITVILTKKHIWLSSGGDELRAMGRNIKLARKRRNWSENELAKKVGIARSTLQLIEQGRPSVSIGAYFQVLQLMGLQGDFALLAQTDEPGRKIADEKLLNKKSKPEKSVDYEAGFENDT